MVDTPGSTVVGRTKVSIDKLINEQVVSGKVEDDKLILITRDGAEIFAGDVATAGPGTPGVSISKVFTFSTASRTWVLQHDFNTSVDIVILNNIGEEITTRIDRRDPNKAIVYFYHPTTGTAEVTN